ncbi:Hypothetical protein PAU_00907 [Photorhabdus asymbiotica]|uniref:Uncharacterized protein n=1 Tax=Photorhabdus asymbiotica subsp. asymbiotica (strain ATCC 43949 / 3105-77) TaxID=553480 RepID=B6VMV0_PHOAA|nr:Hypothetical protein PAU_00907 [Photorhabdus asymbiotica]CAR67480.1 Hypothetical protein PA-RVA14-1104 [Photorhabdus asymbiotica subsp. asymbiotica ATCC 43949]
MSPRCNLKSIGYIPVRKEATNMISDDWMKFELNWLESKNISSKYFRKSQRYYFF